MNPVNLTRVNDRCLYLDRVVLVTLSLYISDVDFSRDGSYKWYQKMAAGNEIGRYACVVIPVSTFTEKYQDLPL